MQCPKCGHAKNAGDGNIKVTDCRQAAGNTFRRRRKCPCGFKFTTVEMIVGGSSQSTRAAAITDSAVNRMAIKCGTPAVMERIDEISSALHRLRLAVGSDVGATKEDLAAIMAEFTA